MCTHDPRECQPHLEVVQLGLVGVITTAPLLILAFSALDACHFQEPDHSICITNGMVTILVSIVLGYLPTFLFAMTSEHPCASAIGGCGTLSCACGNYHPAGYMWMYFTLSLTSLLAQRALSFTPRLPLWGAVLQNLLNPRCEHSAHVCTELTLVFHLGLLGVITSTAVIPALAEEMTEAHIASFACIVKKRQMFERCVCCSTHSCEGDAWIVGGERSH